MVPFLLLIFERQIRNLSNRCVRPYALQMASTRLKVNCTTYDLLKLAIENKRLENNVGFKAESELTFLHGAQRIRDCQVFRREGGNILFNDALNTFYLRLYGIRHIVKDHSDSERGNPLPPHRLLFPINTH